MHGTINYSCYLLLLLFSALLDHAYAQSDVGSGCILTLQRYGWCQLVNQCPSVYDELVAGRPPKSLCGFQDGLPIVCCPSSDELNMPERSGCRLSQGSGVCRLIDQCQSVYNALLAGRRPEVVCGYQGSTPIVCCPSNGVPSLTTTSRPIWGGVTNSPTTARNPLANARPARRMCAEYAKSVYTLVQPPALAGGDEALVNVSVCAITDKKLIVGGTKAEPKEFPHMAAIGYNMGSSIRWDCGGTLISDRFVLTAAHCTNSPQWGDAQWVRVGDLNLQRTSDDAQPQDRRIIERIRHPNYRRPAQYNDIALMRLQQPVTFNAYVRPACLDVRGDNVPGEKSVATGWGIVDWFDEAGSDDLLKVTLPIVAYGTCASFYTDDTNRLPNGIVDQTQMCAGENGKDTCQGDSGGPLVVYSTDEDCMYDVIGVTSFGQLCGSVSPGIYSRVSYYASWIESVVWPNMG